MTEPTYCADGPNADLGQGILESPNFPRNYPDNNTTQWNISVPAGYLAMLTFTNFTLEPWRAGSASPCYDYVEVSYGGYSDQFCGSSIPGPFTSTTTIEVKFRSDYTETRSGFLAVICCSAHVTTDLTSGELINTLH